VTADRLTDAEIAELRRRMARVSNPLLPKARRADGLGVSLLTLDALLTEVEAARAAPPAAKGTPADATDCGCDEGGICERHRIEGHTCGEGGPYCDSDVHRALRCAACEGAAWIVVTDPDTKRLALTCSRCGAGVDWRVNDALRAALDRRAEKAEYLRRLPAKGVGSGARQGCYRECSRELLAEWDRLCLETPPAPPASPSPGGTAQPERAKLYDAEAWDGAMAALEAVRIERDGARDVLAEAAEYARNKCPQDLWVRICGVLSWACVFPAPPPESGRAPDLAKIEGLATRLGDAEFRRGIWETRHSAFSAGHTKDSSDALTALLAAVRALAGERDEAHRIMAEGTQKCLVATARAEAAEKERDEARRGGATCIDDDGAPFASARTWRAAHAVATARAEAAESSLSSARGAETRLSGEVAELIRERDAALRRGTDAAARVLAAQGIDCRGLLDLSRETVDEIAGVLPALAGARRLPERRSVTVCCYCGLDAAGPTEVIEHVAVCAKSPWPTRLSSARRAAIEEAATRVAELLAARDLVNLIEPWVADLRSLAASLRAEPPAVDIGEPLRRRIAEEAKREAEHAVMYDVTPDGQIDPASAQPLVALRAEPGAREALAALRQQVEDTILVAQTDADAEGWITAYHFKTGAIHRLIAKAREPGPFLPSPAPPPASDPLTNDAPAGPSKVNVAMCRELRAANKCEGVACPDCPACASPSPAASGLATTSSSEGE
jgi:hypothetical protein